MAFNATQLEAMENCILNQIPEYLRRAKIDKSKLGDLLSELQKIVKEPGNVLYENFDDGVDLTREGRTLWVKVIRDYQLREVMKPTGEPPRPTIYERCLRETLPGNIRYWLKPICEGNDELQTFLGLLEEIEKHPENITWQDDPDGKSPHAALTERGLGIWREILKAHKTIIESVDIHKT
jgi:hypothetical protein